MTVVAKRLVSNVQLANSTTTYYTVAAGVKTILKKLTFTNNDSSNRLINVYVVDSGGSPGDASLLINAKYLFPGQTWDCFELSGHVMHTGDTLQMDSDAATAVTVRVSGVEIT